ncbi:hypothetical protein PSDVSF_09620 [Pseudodesulfovibrio sediminis]|uniref:Uncharacterized protein n=1 Tax=Pseudodesulfovibrio sediminis TaxID=2810563 RepID=A0ABN6EQN0_9BACT|nr:hypothetical protein PSDVSF_09620 [Pseudodesulfovibrio sediminis]
MGSSFPVHCDSSSDARIVPFEGRVSWILRTLSQEDESKLKQVFDIVFVFDIFSPVRYGIPACAKNNINVIGTDCFRHIWEGAVTL